jgi:hypothetical protein
MTKFVIDGSGWGAILSGLAAFIAAMWAIFREKKKASESNHAKGFDKSAQIIETINEMQNALLDCGVVSIAVVRNGGHKADPAEPKWYTVRYSTDFKTWKLYNDWQQMEHDLVTIHSVTLDEGYCLFFPNQMKDEDTASWYDARGLKKSTCILIGINEIKAQSLVMYVNWTSDAIVSSKVREQVRLYQRKLKELFEPEGWIAKKNFLTN